MPTFDANTYLYNPVDTALRDWLRSMSATANLGVGGKIFVPLTPRQVSAPCIDFHRMPGGRIDQTIRVPRVQFNCWGANPGADSVTGGTAIIERIASALITLLQSTLSRTRLAAGVVLEGCDVQDSFPLPDQKSGAPREVVLASMTFGFY